MRNSDQLRLIAESRRIYNRLVWFTAVLIAGIVLLARPETLDSPLLFGIGITAVIVSLVAIALNIMLVRGLDYDEPTTLANDENDASAMLNFHAERRAAAVKLWTQDENQIKIGLHEMSQRDWKTLYEKLNDVDWHWNRANVAEAGVIKNITAPGVFPALTKEWRELGMLKARHVTGRGRSALREAAGIRVVT